MCLSVCTVLLLLLGTYCCRWPYISGEKSRYVKLMTHCYNYIIISKLQFSSVQSSPLTVWVIRGTWGTVHQKSSSSLLRRRPLWAVLAWAGMSTLWCCPSSISSANHGVICPPRCPEGWLWRGCHGMWHAWAMQVSVSQQLPEEVPVDQRGSWSCSSPNCWSCAPSRRCGEVSSGTWPWKPASPGIGKVKGTQYITVTLSLSIIVISCCDKVINKSKYGSKRKMLKSLFIFLEVFKETSLPKMHFPQMKWSDKNWIYLLLIYTAIKNTSKSWLMICWNAWFYHCTAVCI